jgi:hypothetical protein
MLRDDLKWAAATISQMLADDLSGTAQSAPGTTDANYVVNGVSAATIHSDAEGRLDRLPDGRLEFRAHSIDLP